MVTAIRDCRCVNRCKGQTLHTRIGKASKILTRAPKIINSVLRSAAAEKEEDEDFENRWVVVQRPDQQKVIKPSVAPISSFQSEFLDASIQVLQDFVASRCGENGLGHDSNIYMDWLADDAFGVIDARTAEDNTILFCVREMVDVVQEAEVRVAWDKGLFVHI